MNVDTLTADAKNVGRGLSKRREFIEQLRQMPHLRVLSGPSKGEASFVNTALFRIGKGYNNQFILSDAAVIGYHLTVEKNAIGAFMLTVVDPITAPVFVRRWGRYRAISHLALKDGMVLRLGKQGPRLKYRYLGDTENLSRVSKFLGSGRDATELLPETQVKSRLDQFVTGPRLSDAERHYIRQASQYLSVVSSYRQWLLFLTLSIFLLSGLAIYLKMSQTQATSELTRAREQLKNSWIKQDAQAEAAAAPKTAEGTAEQDKSDLMLANDRTARGIQSIISSFGLENQHVPFPFVGLVKAEIDKEKERLLRDSDLEGFLERYRRYHARVEDIFRKEYQLPAPVSYVAWIESDYFIDAESEKSELGMWQFTVQDAVKYELITPKGEDFRQDFERSTRAAGHRLSDLLAQFGMENFMVALAAYDCGPETVLDIYRKFRLWPAAQRNFPFIIGLKGDRGASALPEDTIRYVPRFFAANLIGSDMSFYLGK